MSSTERTRPGITVPETSAPFPGKYKEESLTIETAPLDLAVRLSQAENLSQYALYECHGEWSLGLGAAWSLQVNSQGAVHSSDGLQWHGETPCKAIALALNQLALHGWRAYGRALFEFSCLKHGTGVASTSETLLWLTVPRSEVRLSEGRALVRCMEPDDMSRLVKQIRRLDRDGAHPAPAEERIEFPQASDVARAQYQEQVASAVAEIQAGLYQKVILSRSAALPADLDFAGSYLLGRRSNTPARSFLLRDGDFECYGFSPETVVEVNAQGVVSTQPLAGTRALPGVPAQDERLRQELLKDPKEIAEHAVSVKLAIDEMEPVCCRDSVAVVDFMSVSPRGSVQHLSSRVRGKLAQGRHAWDAFESLFPAVTASGIPKREAVESIRRHEPHARGLYSGCVMTVDSDGQLDAALVLRSVFRQGGECRAQAGAGVVAMSTPQREWDETREKMDSVVRYLRRASTA